MTVRAAPDPAPFGSSPYRNQELLPGTRVYTVSRITVHDDAGRPVADGHVGSGNARTAPTVTAR